MDRTISSLATSLIAVALAGPALFAQGPGVEITGTLTFPSGTKIDPSKISRVQVTVGAKQISAEFTPDQGLPDAPGGKKKTQRQDSQKKDTKKEDVRKEDIRQDDTKRQDKKKEDTQAPPSMIWLWVSLAVIASVGLGASVFWYYFRRYLPRKELEPYFNAVRAIRARNFEAALPGLTAIESKLPQDLRNNARFFIALCHVHLKSEVEAEQLLSSLHRERPRDPNVAYLLAYLRITRNMDAEAEPVLESMSTHGHDTFRDTRRLIGIMKFRLGMQALRAGEIELAASRFADVEKLGDFAAFIPGDLRNRHISLGTRALFEGNVAGAREHFEALQRAGSAMSPETGAPFLAKASLGLALAYWIEEGPARGMEMDKRFAETCLLFHAEGPTELPWPEAAPGSAKGSAEELKRALDEADKNFDLPADQKDIRRCLRDLHLLRALAVVRFWISMEGDAAHKAIPAKLKDVLSRLACARALDERFADVYLVAGLLMFYLHEPGPERINGADILTEARKLGVRDPDALEIVNNRERIERENADSVDRYQQVLDRYLRDETVLLAVRHDLLNRLATHRSLMNRYKPPDLSRSRTIPPTVNEMRDRSSVLRERVSKIQVSDPNSRLKERSEQLKKQGDDLVAQAQALEKTESDLLVLTGEHLFSDK